MIDLIPHLRVLIMAQANAKIHHFWDGKSWVVIAWVTENDIGGFDVEVYDGSPGIFFTVSAEAIV